MWRAFFGNLSTGLLQASDRAKFRFLQASVKSVAAFRWARWPFQQSYAAKLDRTQRKMIGHLLQIRPRPDESVDEFVQRRHSITSRKARHMGLWSLSWAGSCVSWNAHVTRRHDDRAWSHHLLCYHDLEWLAAQRHAMSAGRGGSRTGTRVRQGKPQRRWQEGVELAATLVARR